MPFVSSFDVYQDLRNTVGNIPMEWYREFEHIGYDLDGKKIGKPATGDELDNFLDKMDNPNYWSSTCLYTSFCSAITRLLKIYYICVISFDVFFFGMWMLPTIN